MPLEPGEECPTCEQRIPYPPKPSSPPTRKKGYWLPADEYAAHESVLRDAAKFLGVHEQPFWEFKTATLALALVLQDESLKGFGQREGAAHTSTTYFGSAGAMTVDEFDDGTVTVS